MHVRRAKGGATSVHPAISSADRGDRWHELLSASRRIRHPAENVAISAAIDAQMPQQLISEANASDYANEIAMGAVLLMVAIADGPYLLRRIRMAVGGEREHDQKG